ncbi:MAG: ribosome biogenesis GTPase Der [Candidatus Marinimicrobia bacterium]|jgi:GTP-binding protein|nr:ribosome biogenesis GTPase Der [Candidatus Neomarinimicrobiota bacterium]MBT3634931.1 ribosome biogenesis GTPase Der [Candidatus Neomarinimicrobiota bacterium]MBT3683783.1 ribosome biogenesis GTPase Der [Candidatus Neomarinimicrobiota bacterium]MBT3760567.1 ribosome biogenesis GTPase Der [Candidatus Neomarinimicrobiota bacterium]MBT3896694.1 ribosome biogenesis GTPase Der [Candidatus Neomarinimicrobiota bacterium]
MADPIIAILGRPNVGKSTLFNRLVGKRHAIVSDVEGVTRDRIYGKYDWAGRSFNVIDTGGYLPESEDVIEMAVRFQADKASREADFIILMVDGRDEITSSDRYLADMLIKQETPYLLVMNKIDDQKYENNIFQFFELGVGEPFSVSAISGRNIGDLLDFINEKIPERQSTDIGPDDQTHMAIVGMPNVGKSSLMNALLQEEKSIVTKVPGTTRDSVDSYINYFGKTYRLIDTAGLRKMNKMEDSIEYYSTVRTFRVIDEANLAIVMIDAKKGFCSHDRNVARYIVDQGRAMILVVNKWDLIEKDHSTMQDFKKAIHHFYKAMEHYPILFVSVHHNRRIRQILEQAKIVSEEYSKKIATAELNEFFKYITIQNPPPAVKGKNLKIKYATQVHSSPPIIAIFTNHPELFPINYKRYIENQLREAFGFQGVPIKISFRKK